jgi:hypothetical protein
VKIGHTYHFRWMHTVLCVLVLVACKKDDPVVQLHEDYFGFIPGRYVVYDVVEINHDKDAMIQHDTNFYQLKTVIGNVYIDNAGRTSREYLRYTRMDTDFEWDLKDAWTAIIENFRAELVEENQRIIKLVFAPTLNKEWNMNAFNAQDELDAVYKDVHTKRTIGSYTYDSTVQVDQEDFFSLIDYRVKSEIYAKKVGLVSKYYKDLEISNFDTLDVRKGKELYYTCSSFGFE